MGTATTEQTSPASFERSDRICGRTLRWTWTEGAVKGSTHEHVFNDDGSVQWSCIDGPGKGHDACEKAYAAVKVTGDVHVVSYLNSIGWTLTVVLNFRDHSMVGFASNGQEWSPSRGTFEVVKSRPRRSAVPLKASETPRVEVGRPLRVAGLKGHFSSESRKDILAQWQRFLACLGKFPGQNGAVTYGLCFDRAAGFDYLSGIEVSQSSEIPAEFSFVDIPTQKYAVFPHREHVSKIHETIDTVFEHWLPASGHALAKPAAGAPAFFERYDENFDPDSGLDGMEVWIPIKG